MLGWLRDLLTRLRVNQTHPSWNPPHRCPLCRSQTFVAYDQPRVLLQCLRCLTSWYPEEIIYRNRETSRRSGRTSSSS